MQEPIRDRFEIQYFKCQSNPVSLNTYLSNLRFISRTLQINLYTSLSISCVLKQLYEQEWILAITCTQACFNGFKNEWYF